MFSHWKRGFEDPVHQPWVVASGESLAPHQYRVVYPVLWRVLDGVLQDRERADSLLLFLTILSAYTATYALFRRASGHVVISGLGLMALHASFSHPYQFQFRETFIEILLTALALLVWSRADRARSLPALLVLSIVGSLNRETWIFLLFALLIESVWRSRGPLKGWFLRIRSDPAALGCIAGLAVFPLCYLGIRALYGIRPYYCNLMPWTENLPHLLFWRDPAMTLGHGLWGVGGGLLILWLLSVACGNRHLIVAITTYLVTYLPVTFLFSRWIESRLFFGLFVLVILSLIQFSVQSDGTRLSARPSGRASA